MKNDLTCGVVGDLLPSYVENLLGEESRAAVERHLKDCPDCTAKKIESDTDGALVNWTSVFELIDTLYSGFHTKLHTAWGETLTLKEEQIIALMVAGFSTKEISVITGQTASTIYVRKSSIRKKLGVPEKQDIVAFLREEGGG